MPTESFNFINYSDQTAFAGDSSGRIELEEYSDDLLLYSNFDGSINATYATSVTTAPTTGSPTTENFGVFGQHLDFTSGGTVKYDFRNFTNLTTEGSIKIRVKPSFTKGYGHQDFLATTNPTIAGDTVYNFVLYVNDTLLGGDSTVVSLVTGDTMYSIHNKIYAEINGNGATSAVLSAGNIRILAEVQGDSVLLLTGNGNDLLTLLDEVGSSELPNPPSVDSKLFDIYNESNNRNRITLLHEGAGDSLTEGNILLKIYDSVGDSVVNADLGLWNVDYDTWYAFELNWNKSMYQLFLDGVQIAIGATSFTRSNAGEKFILQATVTDPYKFDELIVYEQTKDTETYTVETAALTQYRSDDPYIDIYFGDGFKEHEVRDLNLTCSSECKFIVKIGASWYYYLAGSWVISDGTYSQSTTPANMETKFAELSFNQYAELLIRIYFHSDGSTLEYLDEIEIVQTTGDSIPAIVTGTVSLTEDVDLSSNYNFVITTNQGNDTVDLRTGVADSTSVSLAEIKAAINTASITGLDTVSDDGDGHLVLMSLTKGPDASVATSSADTNDALSIVWGYIATDIGEEAEIGAYIDYSELFRYVRSQLGEPIIPVELTDEQIEDCLSESVYWYNYYRNFEEKVTYTNLSGNNAVGYDIPAAVDTNSIMEIILRPRFPFMYYAGREDLISNLYMQYIFQRFKAGYTTHLADYYITLSTEADLNIVLGTQVKWEVREGKLFIWPDPHGGMSIGIRYASALTLAEINTNRFIRKFVLAEAKIVLGGIRSTFKSGIPMGSDMAQLNGEDLIAQGNTEKAELMDQLRKMGEPLFLSWF